MPKQKPNPEPETRVGICCGCQRSSMPLYKVPGIFRYRCAECFLRETGYQHHMAPRIAPSQVDTTSTLAEALKAGPGDPKTCPHGMGFNCPQCWPKTGEQR
jgi:hypothetical protein